MAMREYNTYDMYGLLQGLLDALGRHANAIPLQVRVELATAFIEAFPEHPDNTLERTLETTPRTTQLEKYKQQAVPKEPMPVAPKLSQLGAMFAH